MVFSLRTDECSLYSLPCISKMLLLSLGQFDDQPVFSLSGSNRKKLPPQATASNIS